MSQKSPVDSFESIKNTSKFKEYLNKESYSEDSDIGCFDVEYL